LFIFFLFLLFLSLGDEIKLLKNQSAGQKPLVTAMRGNNIVDLMTDF